MSNDLDLLKEAFNLSRDACVHDVIDALNKRIQDAEGAGMQRIYKVAVTKMSCGHPYINYVGHKNAQDILNPNVTTVLGNAAELCQVCYQKKFDPQYAPCDCGRRRSKFSAHYHLVYEGRDTSE